MVTNSYTISRSMDYVNENTTIGTPIDFAQSWGRSNFDRTHNYVASAIYELPFGPGKPWMTDSTTGKIIGGWQVSALFVAQSGTPLTITGNGTLFNTPGNTVFANVNGEQKVLGGLGAGNLYFDPTVYSLPGAGQQGNMRRNTGPEGPGFWQLDMSIFKRFAFGKHGATPNSGSTRSTRRTPPAGAIRTRASARRPATRSARSPVWPARRRNGSSGSGAIRVLTRLRRHEGHEDYEGHEAFVVFVFLPGLRPLCSPNRPRSTI